MRQIHSLKRSRDKGERGKRRGENELQGKLAVEVGMKMKGKARENDRKRPCGRTSGEVPSENPTSIDFLVYTLAARSRRRKLKVVSSENFSFISSGVQ